MQLTDLDEQEINTILAGLAELPYKHVVELIPKIQLQAVRQVQAANKTTEAST